MSDVHALYNKCQRLADAINLVGVTVGSSGSNEVVKRVEGGQLSFGAKVADLKDKASFIGHDKRTALSRANEKGCRKLMLHPSV